MEKRRYFSLARASPNKRLTKKTSKFEFIFANLCTFAVRWTFSLEDIFNGKHSKKSILVLSDMGRGVNQTRQVFFAVPLSPENSRGVYVNTHTVISNTKKWRKRDETDNYPNKKNLNLISPAADKPLSLNFPHIILRFLIRKKIFGNLSHGT